LFVERKDVEHYRDEGLAAEAFSTGRDPAGLDVLVVAPTAHLYASEQAEGVADFMHRSGARTVKIVSPPIGGEHLTIHDSGWTVEELEAEAEITGAWMPPHDDGRRPWKLHPLGAPGIDAGRFPIESFPPRLQDLIRELAASMTTPEDFVGASMLAVAGAAIGQSVNLALTRTWTEGPQLYVALVGDPGQKKTPPLKWLTRPMAEIDHERHEVWRSEIAIWEKQDAKTRPAAPVRRRALTQDVTTESIAIIHSENPRGLLVYRDELTGWVASFNQYKARGADRQFWLSNASGAMLQVDRKGGRESFCVPHPMINVCGGLTPDNLSVLAGDDMRGAAGAQVDDGFMDRLIFAYPDAFPPQLWTDDDVTPDSEDLWSGVIRDLYSLEMAQSSGRERPWLIHFTPEAKNVWAAWHDCHMGEVSGGIRELNEFPECPSIGRVRGIWSKYRATCARIALILSRLRVVSEGVDEPGLPGDVTLEDVSNAIAIVEYFKRTARKVLASTQGGKVKLPDDERAIIGWIASRGHNAVRFTSNNINSSLGRFRKNPDRLRSALDSLVSLDCIRPLPGPPRTGRPGRPPSPSYEVNPHLHSEYSFNPENPQEVS
jgi:hypothetical protein